MISDYIFEVLVSRLGDETKTKLMKSEPLGKHTTMRVGGPASIFAIADTVNALGLLIQVANEFKIPYFILGKGSNLLVSDEGYPGLVIQLGADFRRVSVDRELIQAGAATSLSLLVQTAYRNGLAGLAWAVGIPGSLGGALVLNAGAHRFDMSRIVQAVTVYHPSTGLRRLDRAEIEFDYRESSLTQQGVIVEAILKLKAEEPRRIRAQMERYFKKRKETQPLQLPSAGSIFKNPSHKLPAAKLIEEVGCKGMQVGGAQVSPKHANFIVNVGAASANDVYSLVRVVQEKVSEERNIILEPEITLLGRFAASSLITGKNEVK